MQGFTVISIHTPEFDWEKDRSNVQQTAQRFGLKQPIYLDNDSAYWEALGNHYWPAFFLVDKRGRVRMNAFGEMHAGAGDATQFERAIEKLLAEKA